MLRQPVKPERRRSEDAARDYTMSVTEIAQILAALEELKQEVQAIKAWQTSREQRDHDDAVRAAERVRWIRFVIHVGRSPVVPWIFAGAGVLWATLR